MDIVKMSSEDSCKIITVVQNRIERCLRMYMNQKEVENTLFIQDKIEPRVTELVWQKLEEENPDFFRAYYLRLMVKEQIVEFNKLLSEQVQLMHQLGPAGTSSIAMSNGAPIPLMHQKLVACQAEERPGGSSLKADTMQQQNLLLSSNLHDVFSNNCGSASVVQSCAQLQPPAPSMSSSLSQRMDVSANNMLLGNQSSNRGVLSSSLMDGTGMIQSEPGYAARSNFPFEFGAVHTNHHLVESGSALRDATVSSYSSGAESNSQPFNEASGLLDSDNPSFGLLEQISPHYNFALTDFPPGILDDFSRPLLMASDSDNFVNHHGDVGKFNAATEGFGYDDLGGNK